MKLLRRTQFGNPILRTKSRRLEISEIESDRIQKLIEDMRYTLDTKKYGVGLAANQIGRDVAISVIGIKPTPTRPNLPMINMNIINPVIVKQYGEKEQMWEGCVSFGDAKNFPYAKVPRSTKIRLHYLNEKAQECEADFEGLLAQVIQHEVDHLNGILFVDRVTDPTTYITISEYKKRFMQKK